MADSSQVNVTVDSQGGASKDDTKKAEEPMTPEAEIKKLQTQQEKMQTAIKKLQNPRAGAKGEELAPWQQLFIKIISPKLISFDKPLLVAVLTATLTLIACAALLYGLLTDCTTVQASKHGSMLSQKVYVVAMRNAGTQMCLRSSTYYSVPSSSNGRLEEGRCTPDTSFVGVWESAQLQDIASAEELTHAAEGLAWCDGAEALNLKLCEAETGGACPSCASTGQSRISFQAVYDETTCASALHSVFLTFCVSSKFEVLIAFILIFVLLATGVLKQYGPTGEKMGFSATVKNDWGNVESLQ